MPSLPGLALPMSHLLFVLLCLLRSETWLPRSLARLDGILSLVLAAGGVRGRLGTLFWPRAGQPTASDCSSPRRIWATKFKEGGGRRL